MAPASNEEQFKFLISCIRYSNNGKVDFGQVAKECGIVSKGAAAKRYERMMRAHGIPSTANNIKPSGPARSSKSERSPSATGSARKRKADQFIEDPNPADDEEGFEGNMNIKGEGDDRGPQRFKKQMFVKEEPDRKPLIQNQQQTQMSLADANELLRYYNPSSSIDNDEATVADDGLYGSGDFEINGGSSASAGFASSSSMIGRSSSAAGSSGMGSSSTGATRYGMTQQNSLGFEYNNGGYGAGGGFGYGGSSGMGMMTSSPTQAASFQKSFQIDSKGCREESPLLVE